MTHRIVPAAVAAALLALAPAAMAAPARTGTVAVGTEFAWDGGPFNGIAALQDISDVTGCTPGIAECDDTLLKIEATGALAVQIGEASTSAPDLDLYIHESDEAGKDGTILKSSAGPTADEQTTLDVEPGYYLVRVRAAISFGGTYKGKATLEAPPVEPPPPGGTPPPPPPPPAANVAPKTTVTKPTGRRITTIRGTASDDGKVAKVRAGIVRIKGKRCDGLTAKGTFKRLKKCTAPILLTARGTTKWSLRLRKPLPKGSYRAYALATDDKGLSEGGYGKRNSVAFRVR